MADLENTIIFSYKTSMITVCCCWHLLAAACSMNFITLIVIVSNCSVIFLLSTEDGAFDQPLTQQQQDGMRAVQNTLEKLDSKHGILQRHASAECVRDASEETDFLKRWCMIRVVLSCY